MHDDVTFPISSTFEKIIEINVGSTILVELGTQSRPVPKTKQKTGHLIKDKQ